MKFCFKWCADKARMAEWSLLALVCAGWMWAYEPQQLPVMVYKAALIFLFAHVGYLVDRRANPNARLGVDLVPGDEGYNAARLGRAILMAATVIGGALAL